MIKHFAVILVMATLTACGGGGNSSSNNNTETAAQESNSSIPNNTNVNSNSSCEFSFSSVSNGASAALTQNYWTCVERDNDSAAQYRLAFFDDGAGFTDGIGAFTWQETDCAQATATSNIGSVEISNITGSSAIGVVTFESRYDNGELTRHSCVLTALPNIAQNESEVTPPEQAPESEVPAGDESNEQLLESPVFNGVLYSVFAQNGQFLGVINNNPFDANSLCNAYGTYGNKYATKSIWNQYGSYGSPYATYSAYNIYSSTPVTGGMASILGAALQFDGVDDWVEVANSVSLNPSREITLEVNQRLQSFGGIAGNRPLIQKITTINATDNTGYDNTFFGTNGDYYFQIGNRTVFVPIRTVIEDWKHLVGTFDGANGKIYSDGILLLSSPLLGAINPNSQPLWIGKRFPFSSPSFDFYNGNLNDIIIYSRAITAGEIQNNFLSR